MADLYDAVTWENLVGKPGFKVGYADGPVSEWPAEAYTAVTGVIPFRITVLANPQWQLFDSETGNAGTDAVANAVAGRLDAGEWSVIYTNRDNLAGLNISLSRKSIGWTDASHWPARGVYLWAAAPGETPGQVPSWCPVQPVAVQDRWEGGFDVSSCFGAFPELPAPGPGPAPVPPPPPAPVPAPPPAPPPPIEGWCIVNMRVLAQGATGEDVRALQALLNLRGASPQLATDGDFGPLTDAALVHFEWQHGTAGGNAHVVGALTWNALLNQ